MPAVAKNSEYRPSGSRLSIIEGSEPTDRPRRKRSSHMAGGYEILDKSGNRVAFEHQSGQYPGNHYGYYGEHVCMLVASGLTSFLFESYAGTGRVARYSVFCAGGTVFVSGMFFASLPFFVFLSLFLSLFLPGLPLSFPFSFDLRRKVWAIRQAQFPEVVEFLPIRYAKTLYVSLLVVHVVFLAAVYR